MQSQYLECGIKEQALRRQRLVDLCTFKRSGLWPGLLTEFLDSHSFTEKPCLGKTKRRKRKKRRLYVPFLGCQRAKFSVIYLIQVKASLPTLAT